MSQQRWTWKSASDWADVTASRGLDEAIMAQMRPAGKTGWRKRALFCEPRASPAAAPCATGQATATLGSSSSSAAHLPGWDRDTARLRHAGHLETWEPQPAPLPRGHCPPPGCPAQASSLPVLADRMGAVALALGLPPEPESTPQGLSVQEAPHWHPLPTQRLSPSPAQAHHSPSSKALCSEVPPSSFCFVF